MTLPNTKTVQKAAAAVISLNYLKIMKGNRNL